MLGARIAPREARDRGRTECRHSTTGIAVLGLLAAATLPHAASAAPISFDFAGFGYALNDAALGPGGGIKTTSTGVSWNVEASIGKISAGTGFRVTGESAGRAGLSLGYGMGGMLTDLDYSATSRVTFDQVSPNAYIVGSDLRRGAGSSLATTGLQVGVQADFKISGSAGIEATGCFLGGCDSGGDSFTFPNTTLSLLRTGNLSSSAPLTLFGQPLAVEFGQPYVVLASADCPHGVPLCGAGFEVGRGTLFNPNLAFSTTTGGMDGLSVSKTSKLAELSADLDFLLSALTLMPQPGVTAEFGPITASIDLYDIDAAFAFNLVQNQSFVPNATHHYSFSRTVRVAQRVKRATLLPNARPNPLSPLTCGQLGIYPDVIEVATFSTTAVLSIPALETGVGASNCFSVTEFTRDVFVDSLDFAADDQFMMFVEGEPVEVTASTALDPLIETELGLLLTGELQLDVLKVSASFEDFEKSLGPVYEHDIPLFEEPFRLYRNKSPLERATCGETFMLGSNGVTRDADTAFCGRFLPVIAPETVEAQDPGLPELPMLTVVEIEEVPEPASAMLVLGALIGLVRAARAGGRRAG